MLLMGVTYYLYPSRGKAIYSLRLVQYSFWLTLLGVFGFYAAKWCSASGRVT